VDTNVFVRFVTGDDLRQAAIAQTVLDEDFAVTATVLLETEWVLGSRYGFDRSKRAQALRMLLDLPHAVIVPNHARWAIDRMQAGGDFADMMHLAGAEGASRFATFDEALAQQAGTGASVPVETLG
jgi:predicted nucleic acid-binding protein